MPKHKEIEKQGHSSIHHKCPEYGCKKPADIKCKYCQQYFCKDHVSPKLVGSVNYIENIIKVAEPEKYKEYIKDHKRTDGHACGVYTDFWNKEFDKKNEDSNKKFLTALDKLKSNKTYYYESHTANNYTNGEYSNYYSQSHHNRSNEIANKPHGRYSFLEWAYKFLFYKRGLRRMIIIATVLTIMLAFNFVLVSNYSNSSFLLGDYGFVIDLLVILFISLIINLRDKWADFIGAFLSSIFLGIVMIPTINSTTSFLEVFASFLGILYLSTLAGNVIRHRHFNKVEAYLSYVFRTVFIILFLLVIASAVTNQSTISSFNTSFSGINSTISSTLSSISSSISGPQINATWANEFFSGLNSYRSIYSAQVLEYCPSLSSFAKVRFNTMVKNYEISHYGYDQDLKSYFGNVYNVAFEEEYFFPSGYTPADYLDYIQEYAPIHWQGLINSTYDNYGFYIAHGPNYEVSGPDGDSCPVTEIPGPNINIPQFLAQYGCTVQVENQSWFIVELASSCP